MNACMILLVATSALQYLPPEVSAATDADALHSEASFSIPLLDMTFDDVASEEAAQQDRMTDADELFPAQPARIAARPNMVPVWVSAEAENLRDRFPFGFSDVKLVEHTSVSAYPQALNVGGCDGSCGPSGCDNSCCQDECESGGWCRGKDWLCCHHCGSTCDMIPHYPYMPELHGYYYFRPYNYTYIKKQQEIAVSLGGDASAPYATTMFEKFYADLYEEPEAPSDDIKAPSRLSTALPDLQELLDGNN